MRSISETCVDINISNTELSKLVSKAKDWVFLKGLVMKSKENLNQDQVNIAPFLFLPTSFPKKEFFLAKEVQSLLNELIHKVAYNHKFLTKTLKSTVESDTGFTAKLFNIYQTIYAEGFSQEISLGLIRSDYMLHTTDENKIKQVEINTISSSFAGLVEVVSKYHRYILTQLGHENKLNNIPENNSASGFASGILEAWKFYNNNKAVILIVVENVTYNIFDQRLIEFKIEESSPDIKILRKTHAELIREALLGPNRELFVDGLEVAVIYYRTGYEVQAYPTEKEWEVRLLLERSRAIKCPSIQYHLAGTKKVQQELAAPGVLEKFISDPIKIAKLKNIFMGLYSLDFNENGDKASAMAINNPEKYVLKPQREGGGNNFYNEDVKIKLESLKNSKDRTSYILMERIHAPLQKNIILRSNCEFKLQDCISELGIYGVIIGDKNKIFMNNQCGHILRTKPSNSDEGGIIFGAGAIDSPFLVD